MEFRAASGYPELGKGAGTDPEILGGFGCVDFAVFDRVHSYLSRCAVVWRGNARVFV